MLNVYFIEHFFIFKNGQLRACGTGIDAKDFVDIFHIGIFPFLQWSDGRGHHGPGGSRRRGAANQSNSLEAGSHCQNVGFIELGFSLIGEHLTHGLLGIGLIKKPHLLDNGAQHD